MLYVRRVYPSNTFSDEYWLGIRYKAHRHPGVVEYISDAINVAVPALIDRVADEFCLEVVEEQTEEIDADTLSKSEPQESINPLLMPSAEFYSSPSNSQERDAKRPRNSSQKSPAQQSSSGKPSDMKPSALFHNQSQSQQSLSSLSSAQIKGKSNNSQNSNITSKNTDNESTPMENLLPEKEEEENNKETILAYKSFQVLEKFSLYFAPSAEELEVAAPVVQDMEDLGRKRQAPLFTKRKRASSKPKGPSEKELQEQAMLEELERGFRNLILNMTSLNRDRVLPSDSLTFKLVLHVNQREKVCSAIEKALEAGSWYPCSAETKALESQRRPRMPLYQVAVSDWDINFHMQRRVEKDDGKN